jgi:hypothetical protein
VYTFPHSFAYDIALVPLHLAVQQNNHLINIVFADSFRVDQLVGLLTWIVIAVVILAIIGLGVGTFFFGVMRGAEVTANNPVIQNATDQTKEFIEEKVNSGITEGNASEDTAILALTSEKTTYKVGEPVTFIIRNNAAEALAFPNSAFGLEITNVDTGQELPIFSAQVITSIEAGESKFITLTLETVDGQEPGEGNYLAKIYTTPRDSGPTAEARFQIIQVDD